MQLLPIEEVLSRTGRGRSSHFIAIRRGLFVPPVAISERSKRYPDYEVEAINAAVVAGKSDEEIRQLVAMLIASRKVAA